MAKSTGKNNNVKYLIPFNKKPKEVARAQNRKGGINSGKSKRRLKSIREALRLAATSPISDDIKKDIAKRLKNYDDIDGDYLMFLATLMMQEATEKHNYKAREQFFDYMGTENDINEDIEQAKSKENKLLMALLDSVDETKDIVSE